MGSVPHETLLHDADRIFRFALRPLRSGSNHICSGFTGATTIVAVLALWIHDEDNTAVKTLVPNALSLLALLHCNTIVSAKKIFSIEI